MVQSASLPNASYVQLARQGNARAIAHWLNQALVPYGIHTRVGLKHPGALKLLVEFQFPFDPENPPNLWREHLIRFICHRLWQLNSPIIRGVNIVARFADVPQRPVWDQSVRIVTPANRNQRPPKRKTSPQHQPSARPQRQPIHSKQQIHSRIRQTSRRKSRLRVARTLLVGGPAVAAIMVGGILGYTRAPVGQTDASASSQSQNNQPEDNQKAQPIRPDTVRTALETIPVVKHNQVMNPQDPTVTLMFSGDVTLADHFEEVIGKNYQKPFASLPEYQQADLAMVNLENPLTRATIPMPNKQFNFKADPESVKVLTTGGVDIANVANNHTMDFEAEGLKETLDTLTAAGIQYVGAGKDLTEARRPKIIDVKGQRIAYLSYWGEEYGAEANKPGVNSIREERIAEDIRAIRDQVDWIVVNFHWGQELAETPADWQTKLGRFTIDHGADVVVGHHPHVLQGAEIYKGRPIAYSLGNFIFGGNSQTDYDTAVLKVALKDKQMKVEFLPVEVQQYQPKVAQGDRGKDIMQKLTQLSSGFQQPMQPSMVLDARTTPSPAPTPPAVGAPGSPEALSSPSPGATEASPSPSPGGSPLPSPGSSPGSTEYWTPRSDGASPAPSGLPTPQGAASPDAGQTYQPTPVDPGEVLPGYGGAPSTPAPVAPIDGTVPAAPATGASTGTDPAVPPSSVTPGMPNSIGPGAPQTPFTSMPGTNGTPQSPMVAPSPQLPPATMVSPSPAASPNTDVAPVEEVTWAPTPVHHPPTGAMKLASSHSISFKIQEPAGADDQPLDEATIQDVALAGPMMW